MPYLVDIQTAFPDNKYSQEELIQSVSNFWKDKVTNLNRIRSIHENVMVKSRHLSVPIEKYFEFKNFDEKNDHFIRCSTELGISAIQKILSRFHLNPSEISSLWSNTITGFAIPSIESRIMNHIDFSLDTKRVPIIGLGCMGGAAGINRVADYLVGHPKEAVIFLSVELCTLTVQMNDFSVANIVSTGLFGDGAAAVLMVGDDHPLVSAAPLKWKASKSVFFKNTEDVMGWNVGQKGLTIQLHKNVPDITETNLPGPLNEFLMENGLELSQIDSFFAHPGGPKVLMAIEKVFDLPQFGLVHSWNSLSECGNMSSVSVLDIFKRTIINKNDHLVGKHAVSLAMGPAFSAEMGLFQWN